MNENPWLSVPLADYEAHMSSPGVGQAQLLADLLAAAIAEHRPRALAVLGCAGGNGFDRIPASVERVVGVDLNPDYVATARARFAPRLRGLELYTGDVTTEACVFAQVELVFAGLLFEYVDAAAALGAIAARLAPGGVLVTALQLPGTVAAVTPSPYKSLLALEAAFRFVEPGAFVALAAAHGLEPISTTTAAASGGKRFVVQTFRASG
jgi:SAM-dependent methyltransferase